MNICGLLIPHITRSLSFTLLVSTVTITTTVVDIWPQRLENVPLCAS